MNVRHDATVILTLTGEYGPERNRQVVEQREVPVTVLDGAITTMGIIYNAECMSGGVRWRDMEGRPFYRPQYDYVLTDPDNQILKDGELCTCDRCIQEDAA